MNSIILTGNICNDLELKTTNSGKSVCSFNIAVRRPFAKDVTDFFTVVVWNKQAENICQYCNKGTRIGLSGMLTTRKWEDNEGNSRTSYEVVAENIEFLEKKSEGQNAAPNNTTTSAPADFPGLLPNGFVAATNEDLPF